MAGPDFDTPVKVGIPNPRVVLDIGFDNTHMVSTGAVKVKDFQGNDLIVFKVDTSANVPRNPSSAYLSILARSDTYVREVIRLKSDASLGLGGGKEPGKKGKKGTNGSILLFDETVTNNLDKKKAMVTLNGQIGHLDLAKKFDLWGSSGDMVIRDMYGTHAFGLHSGDYNDAAGLWIGGIESDSPDTTSPSKLKSGYAAIRNSNGHDSIILDGNGAWMGVHDNDANRAFAVYTEGMTWNNNPVAWLAIGKHKDEEPKGVGKAGVVVVRNPAGDDSIFLNGTNGDIEFTNADCAEEFDISPELAQIEPGTVMVIDDNGGLQISSKAYDNRVAGVISGGGDLKPGIVLDKKKSQNFRAPLAMLGKVFCKVTADERPIKVGDMLTTSNTAGHAMKATNRSRAFGAVIGKALSSLSSGRKLIPILIALQ